MFQLHRITPLMTPDKYRTFQVLAPPETHFRPAKNCEEADCRNYFNGWQMTLDPGSPDHQYYLEIFKRNSARFKYTTEKLEDGQLRFTFPPGQNCFEIAQHRVRIERPELHFIRSGDYRNLGRPVELSLENWQEEFQENQDRLNTLIERG